MKFRPWIYAALLIAASGCHFDGSADNRQNDPGDELAEPDNSGGDDSLVPKPPDTETLLSIYAISESTKYGELAEGSYEDLEAMDETYETILAAVDSDVEKLEQRWKLGEVDAGSYQLAIAVDAYSPIDPETYEVSYRVGDSDDPGEWTYAFQFESGISTTSGTFMSVVEEDILVEASGELELRAKLIDDAPVVEADNGLFSYIPSGGGPSGGGGGGGPGGEPDPVRTLSVNYLSLQPTVVTAGN